MKTLRHLAFQFVATIMLSAGINGSLQAQGTQGAPSSKVQFLHNAADPRLSVIDVYIDGAKMDDIPYLSASSMSTMTPGAHRVLINDASSTDSTDQLIKAINITVPAGSNCIFMLSGVADTTLFKATPGKTDKTNLLLDMKRFSGVNLSGGANAVNITCTQAITDIDGLTFKIRPNNSVGLLRLGDVLLNKSIAARNVLMDVYNGTTRMKSVILPFNGKNNGSYFVFNSGFITPSANNNGPAAAYYAIDTAGGMATLLNAGGEIQFIHNAADITLSQMDVYVNGTLMLDGIQFRKATPYAAMPVGAYTITLKKHGISTDLYTSSAVNLAEGNSFIAIANGVIDTDFRLLSSNNGGDSITKKLWNNYSYDHAAVSGRSIGLNVYFYQNGKSTSSISPNNEVLFFQGITDAPASFSMMGEKEAIPAATRVQYANFFKYVNAKYNSGARYIITNPSTGDQLGVYNMQYNRSGEAGVLFASGFVRSADTIHVKYVQHAKNKLDTLIIYNTFNFKGEFANLFVAWPDGTVDAGSPELRFTGIESVQKPSLGFTVFPNPSHGSIQIQSNEFLHDAQLGVYDVNGRLVHSQIVQGNENSLALDMLVSGIYFVRISTDNATYTQKLIIE